MFVSNDLLKIFDSFSHRVILFSAFITSPGMLFRPGAFPLFNFWIAFLTSSDVIGVQYCLNYPRSAGESKKPRIVKTADS